MAERLGATLRRRLRSADRLSERAIACGFALAKTLRSRSSASLLRVTAADHFRGAPRVLRLCAGRGLPGFLLVALATTVVSFRVDLNARRASAHRRRRQARRGQRSAQAARSATPLTPSCLAQWAQQ